MDSEQAIVPSGSAVRGNPGLRVIDGGRTAAGGRGEYGLARLVPVVRERLAIDAGFPDEAILASLQEIARARTPESRWQAAYRSNLGLVLSLRIGDLSQRLDFVIEMVARSGDVVRRAHGETLDVQR